MKWDREKEAILTAQLFVLNSISVDYQAMAADWPDTENQDRPTARAIQEHVKKIKKNYENLKKGDKSDAASKKGSQSSSEAKITPSKRKKTSGISKPAKSSKTGASSKPSSSAANLDDGSDDASDEVEVMDAKDVDSRLFNKSSSNNLNATRLYSAGHSDAYEAYHIITPPQEVNIKDEEPGYCYTSRLPVDVQNGLSAYDLPNFNQHYVDSNLRTKVEPVDDPRDSDATEDDPAFAASTYL